MHLESFRRVELRQRRHQESSTRFSSQHFLPSIWLSLLICSSLLLPTKPFVITNKLEAWQPRCRDTSSTRNALLLGDSEPSVHHDDVSNTRRVMLSRFGLFLVATLPPVCSRPLVATATQAEDDVKELRAILQEAQRQLETVPALLKEEKWDGVRQILTEVPLRDCWSKSTPVLKKYAEALGETPKGDELAALEGREDLLQHLRFLDMAVYNNVFNPIATEGKTGASKALIDSYYNDPTREYEASKRAIESLLELSN